MSFKPLIVGALLALMLAPFTSAVADNGAFTQKGAASYYADRFHGRQTASGKRYDKRALTAAHKTLPLGTQVRVTNLKNGNSVVVEIIDRGPYVKGHVLDLSEQAARELRMISAGIAQVQLEVISTQSDS